MLNVGCVTKQFSEAVVKFLYSATARTFIISFDDKNIKTINDIYNDIKKSYKKFVKNLKSIDYEHNDIRLK
jgi:hypothetical protein